MGFIDYMDRTVIKGLSALEPDKQYSETIERRQEWFCCQEIHCYGGRDFVNTEEYARQCGAHTGLPYRILCNAVG